jgi:hypothetical protein
MPYLIEAVECYATLGEVADTLAACLVSIAKISSWRAR